ncbi:sensor histidine kinase [Devosia geojensis]|nr:HAMP domain-containing sensor histidine kinase [Devosia geojensis]
MTSTTAARVQVHANDARPAWLFSSDGALIWRNLAAAYFLAKAKKHSVRVAAPAEPIKGQIARVLRLGSQGRTSLSRIQFMAGEKPASATCACTPLEWAAGQQALLIVGVDTIDKNLLESGAADLSLDATLWMGGARGPIAERGPSAPEDRIAPAEPAPPEAHEERLDAAFAAEEPEPSNAAAPNEPAGEAPGKPDAAPPESTQRLPDLMDRLMEKDTLFQPIEETEPNDAAAEPAESPSDLASFAEGETDETQDAPEEPAQEGTTAGLFRVIGRYLRRPAEEDEADETIALPPEETEAEADLAALAALDAVEESEAAEPALEAEPVADIEADEAAPAATIDEAEDAAAPPAQTPDAEAVERVSRYNFDELSRILTDRVGEMAAAQPAASEAEHLASAPPGSILARQRASTGTGSLINLGGETLVLNRLPLGILVFRDQQVLFANRAITEMTGYDSVERLREAGLSAIFPGTEGDAAGPVNHLVQHDGTLVPVTARLQSISWQGRPALMLSASATEVRTGHEGAVRAFAEAFSSARGDGFIEATRAGIVSALSPKAASDLSDLGEVLVGRRLSDIVSQADLPALRAFLERPARFAETERPALKVKAAAPDVELLLFTQGQAGLVTGYFGFVVRTGPSAAPRLAPPSDADAGLLARLSRGVRRPLNTIIGFSDLIRSAAFGSIDNPRYLDYAQDIKTAGEEIAALVDELDDYARLKDGRYLPQRASLDLRGLLESCVRRIRPQAGMRRVIVRNAISENLPRVTADRASLAQAVLNLLASAIDQTPVGGAVVISAQETDEGGIAIHVRDSSENGTDLSERFVVFRDGQGKDGKALTPVRSSVGLALTRSLLAVNAFSLSVDPAGQRGMLFSMVIPADLVERG